VRELDAAQEILERCEALARRSYGELLGG
jgi:hypothetical protein